MITTSINPIDLLDQMLEQGEDIYETAVSIGIQNEHELTAQRWLQGDICLRVESAYGTGIIQKFAVALNVNTSTLKQRRTMSQYYEKDTRYLFDNLGYSHYREAMRIGDTDESIEFLEYASRHGQTVWELAEDIDKHLGKTKQPQQSAEGTIFMRSRGTDGKMHIEIVVNDEDVQWLNDCDVVTIKAR